MKIAVTLIHNKTPQENEAQIASLLSLVTRVATTVTEDQFDEEGNLIGQASFEVYHYEFTGFGVPHEVRFYHVVPYGVTIPTNLDLLDGYKVFYGPEDQDKAGPRFFNWGLKRGIDQGSDISCYLLDPAQLTPQKLRQGIQALKNDVELIDLPWVKLVTKRAMAVIGQLREDGQLADKLAEYKDRIVRGGLKTA